MLLCLPDERLKEHRRALPYAQVPEALARVRESTADISTKLAFEFLVLTASRSVEVRAAEWSEIDWEAATWEVPASRMKARRPHRVPLSGRAMEILREALRFGGGQGLVFPSARSGKAASPTTFIALIQRLGIPAVPHGFRSSFRDWVMERTDTPWAVAEAALAHNVGNSTEAAYMRSDLFEQRRALMSRWTEFVTSETVEEAKDGPTGKTEAEAERRGSSPGQSTRGVIERQS